MKSRQIVGIIKRWLIDFNNGIKAFRVPFWGGIIRNREPIYLGVAVDVCLYVPKGIILDVGTGTGRLPLILARINSEIKCIGIDINETMLNHAKLESQKTEYVNQLSLMRAQAETLPFADKSFDMVVSLMSVYQWNYRLQGCKEIYRVLKDNALTLIIVGNSYMTKDKSGLAQYKDLRKILTDAGFKDVITLNQNLTSIPPKFQFDYLKPSSSLSGLLLVIGQK